MRARRAARTALALALLIAAGPAPSDGRSGDGPQPGRSGEPGYDDGFEKEPPAESDYDDGFEEEPSDESDYDDGFEPAPEGDSGYDDGFQEERPRELGNGDGSSPQGADRQQAGDRPAPPARTAEEQCKECDRLSARIEALTQHLASLEGLPGLEAEAAETREQIEATRKELERCRRACIEAIVIEDAKRVISGGGVVTETTCPPCAPLVARLDALARRWAVLQSGAEVVPEAQSRELLRQLDEARAELRECILDYCPPEGKRQPGAISLPPPGGRFAPINEYTCPPCAGLARRAAVLEDRLRPRFGFYGPSLDEAEELRLRDELARTLRQLEDCVARYCPDLLDLISIPRGELVDGLPLDPEGDLFSPPGVDRLIPLGPDDEPPSPLPVADLGVSKSDAPDPVEAGGMLTYTLTVTNAGPDAGQNVTLSDTLPNGVVPITETTTAGTCMRQGNVVTCTLGSLATEATVTIVITVQVSEDAPDSIANSAVVSSGTADPNADDNSVTAETAVARPQPRSADVRVGLLDSDDPVEAGEAFAYVATIENAGPDGADGVTLTDPLPGGVTPTGASSPQGTCTIAGTTVTCAVGTMAAGASLEVRIDAVASEDAPAEVTNAVTVSATTADPDPGNNTAEETTTITEPAPAACALGIIPGTYAGNAGCGSDGTVEVSCSGPHEVILENGFRLVCDAEGDCGENNTIFGAPNHDCRVVMEGRQVCVSCDELTAGGQPTGRSCTECLTATP